MQYYDEVHADPYVQWGRKTCPTGYARMYWGHVMVNHYTQKKGSFVPILSYQESYPILIG